MVSAGVEYAGFGIRAAARFVDLLVGFVLGMVGGGIGGALSVMFAPAIGEHMSGALTVVSLVAGLLATVGYHGLSEGLGGASIGKLACGLRVYKSDLSPCTVGAAIGRTFAYYIDSFFFGLVAYTSMSKSPQQQRYGDKWAHTVVVKKASLPEGAPAANVGLGILLGVVAHVVISMMSVLSRLVA
jgi:uncharacterized RDD family membrane protein YckC